MADFKVSKLLGGSGCRIGEILHFSTEFGNTVTHYGETYLKARAAADPTVYTDSNLAKYYTRYPTNFNTTGTAAPAAGPNSYAVVGNVVVALYSGDYATKYYTLNNGAQTQYNIPVASNMQYVVAANGRFFMNGSTKTYTSTDGVNWTDANLNVNGNMHIDVAYGGGVYVMTGLANNTIHTSTNGTSWTARTVGNANMRPVSVAYSGTRWVVTFVDNSAADATVLTATSTDGVNWTTNTVTTAFGSPAAGHGFMVRWSSVGSRFVAVGAQSSANSVMVSSDGLTWAVHTGNQSSNYTTSGALPTSVKELNGYVLWRDSGGNLRWTDGTSSTVNSLGTAPASLTSVGFANGRWVYTSGSNIFVTSVDGGSPGANTYLARATVGSNAPIAAAGDRLYTFSAALGANCPNTDFISLYLPSNSSTANDRTEAYLRIA